MSDAVDRLAEAVRTRQRVRFTYNGKTRLVEPQCVGIGTKGTRLLRGHQLDGGRQREPLFDIAKITGLEVTPDLFDRPGPNYARDDSAMAEILAQL